VGVKFSVIIPAYNVAGYLEKCLNSLLAQTYKDYEIIVIDDGSTDETSEIADSYANRNECITVIHKMNEGVSAARNSGIEIASGEYFLFFDGDDFVEPYCMEELAALAKEKQVDTIIYGYHRYENNAVKETCYPIFQKELYEGEEILSDLIPRFIGIYSGNINGWLRGEEKALYVENPALWRSMVSAELIRKNHIRFNTNLKVGEDTIFISDYLSYAERCYVHRKCYYYLVTRETSTIYLYERNPLAKLEGKIKLLQARKELTEEIKQRCQFDLNEYWRGTVIMSCIELAFLLTKKNKLLGYLKRYRLLRRYLDLKDVKSTIKNFKVDMTGGLRLIPFLLLKCKLYFVLFLSASLLHVMKYEFNR
jgi:glycosyltransferase involved in cell wall biosynthesis